LPIDKRLPNLTTSQFAVPFFEPVYGAIGAEFDFKKTFFINGGVQIKSNPMFALGFGYAWRSIRLDASYTPSMTFTNLFSVTFTFTFGGRRSQREE
jgi:hypothetical protein